jgi:hypothetical protein
MEGDGRAAPSSALATTPSAITGRNGSVDATLQNPLSQPKTSTI